MSEAAGPVTPVRREVVAGPAEVARAAATLLVDTAAAGSPHTATDSEPPVSAVPGSIEGRREGAVGPEVEASDSGWVHIALTGGRAGTAMLAEVSANLGAVDLTRVQLWWSDERFLPAGDLERNDTAAFAAWPALRELPSAQVHSIAGPDEVASAEAAAERLAAELQATGVAERGFDLAFLSVGPDGHVASLFPGFPQVNAAGLAVAVHDAPKEPPTRVSMTFPLLNHSQAIVMLATGAEKAQAVRAALGGSPVAACPASGISPRGRLTWLIDAAAAPVR